MTVDAKIIEHTKSILNQFGDKYLAGEQLKKNRIITDLDHYDHDLMAALLSDTLIHDTYTERIAGYEVFKLNQFVSMFEFKEYWEDSYTKYSNKIGLTAGGKFIDESSDVVLDFPFKDTVLKAGMTKEDLEQKDDAEEPFLNETLAKAEIDELLEPKIFKSIKKFNQNGQTTIDQISEDDNLIIKGNNLIALYSLKERYAGKVKLIYLDPPYNTGSDSFEYNDHFTHSSWLAFMKNRLEIAHDLLAINGSIFIQTDDNEMPYLKVLMDEIYGRDNFIGNIIWKKRQALRMQME